MEEFGCRNEQDVREEILAPLLDRLGYRAGGEGDVRRELVLRYPRFSLGRKNSKSDPLLRGRADYVLEVPGHARWVLEAKSPFEEIDLDVIDQARTYALHPEVAAEYFAISNGRKFSLFKTAVPPPNDRLIDLDYPAFLDDGSVLHAALSVNAIKRDFPVVRDFGTPLAPGLRSLAKVKRGTVDYTSSSDPLPAITSMTVSIIDGGIERGVGDQVVASVRVRSPIRKIQELIESLGLDELTYVSASTFISTDREAPSVFRYEGRADFPAGKSVIDVRTWTDFVLPTDVSCAVVSAVTAYLEGSTLKGRIDNVVKYETPVSHEVRFSGSIEIELF